jgi:hypothetical protein
MALAHTLIRINAPVAACAEKPVFWKTKPLISHPFSAEIFPLQINKTSFKIQFLSTKERLALPFTHKYRW